MPRSLVLMLLIVGESLAAQNTLAPKQPLCSITGQVVQESAGTPLGKVSVTLAPSEGSVVFSRQHNREPHSATTDSEGNFHMEGIQPGEYRVLLERNGFLSSTRRSRLYSSTLLSLAAGQELQGLLFRMRPAGVIQGKVVDEDGDAVPGINVTAISPSDRDSVRAATTNDLGEYRIAGLPEGKFLVLAQPQAEMIVSGSTPSQEKIYAPTYYPGSLDQSQAASIEVHTGDETTASFNLISSRIFTIKGRVLGLRPQAPPTAQRRMVIAGAGPTSIVLERADGQDNQSRGGGIAQDGSFEIQGVLPGSYNARINSEHLNRVRVNQTIEVRDSDIDGIQLTTESSVEVRGRFRMDDGRKLDWRQIQIMIDPDDRKQSDGPAVGRMQADGSFIVANVQPGNYHVVVTSSSASLRDYIVKEVNVDGKEVGDSGFTITGGASVLDIVGSAKGSAIEGTAVDDEGKPIPDMQVVCIPDAARRKRRDIYQQVQTDQRGYFSMRGLNAGGYQVFALDDATGDITDQDFVSAHDGQGETVTVEAGERKSIVLKVPPPSD
jgi:Carboxypeptidase regulatory-like domain